MRATPLFFILPLTLAISAQAFSPEQLQLIDQRVEQQLQQRLEELQLLEPQRQERIEQGIETFIQKQQTSQRDAQEAAGAEMAKRARAVDPERDYIRGNPDAPFTLIEYSDFECSFCKRFHNTAISFIDNNDDVNWVYRHFPLENHNPLATLQAEAVECAGELNGVDGFWQLTDMISARTRSGGRGMSLDDIKQYAVETGLVASEFNECFDGRRHQQRVQDDLQDGQMAGITGTPGNLLRHNASGEVIVINGAQPLANLEDALARLRARVE